MHIVLSHALPDGPNCRALLTRPEFPPLPQLQPLFSRLARSAVLRGESNTLTPLHERLTHAHAQAADGLLPLAALAAHAARLDTRQAWGLLTLCHLEPRSDHVAMGEPDELAITDPESDALMQAMRPYFLEDGLTLHRHLAGHWLVCGEPLRDLPTASVERVRGQAVDAWMPQGERGRILRRLQNEMQMLLYTHPVNDDRGARGLAPLNAFWLSGTGDLAAAIPRDPSATTLHAALRDSALRDDAWSWAQAWLALDAAQGPQWLALSQGDPDFCLTLCGSTQAHSYTAQAARSQSWLTRARRAWSPTPFPQRLQTA
jgi:hypothetical protein